MRGDEDQLARVVANLADNAQRYARNRVEFGIAQRGESYYLTVTMMGLAYRGLNESAYSKGLSASIQRGYTMALAPVSVLPSSGKSSPLTMEKSGLKMPSRGPASASGYRARAD